LRLSLGIRSADLIAIAIREYVFRARVIAGPGNRPVGGATKNTEHVDLNTEHMMQPFILYFDMI